MSAAHRIGPFAIYVLTGTELELSKLAQGSCLSPHSQTLQITTTLSLRHQYQPFFVGFSFVQFIAAAPVVQPMSSTTPVSLGSPSSWSAWHFYSR